MLLLNMTRPLTGLFLPQLSYAMKGAQWKNRKNRNSQPRGRNYDSQSFSIFYREKKRLSLVKEEKTMHMDGPESKQLLQRFSQWRLYCYWKCPGGKKGTALENTQGSMRKIQERKKENGDKHIRAAVNITRAQ